MRISQYWIVFFLFLFGCSAPYLSIKKEWIDGSCLASAYVGSPDPQAMDPPQGETLLITWSIPRKQMAYHPSLILEILYQDLSKERVSHSIAKRKAFLTHSLLGKKYKEKGGYLAYKGEIRGENGMLLEEWKQHLWVDHLIVYSDTTFRSH